MLLRRLTDSAGLYIAVLLVLSIGCRGSSGERKVVDNRIPPHTVGNKVALKFPTEDHAGARVTAKPASKGQTGGAATFIDLPPAFPKSVDSKSDSPVILPVNAIAQPDSPLQLDEVIASIRESYPLLESAFLARNIAEGEQISAAGNFDLKLKGASEAGPTGFYQTYRNSIGIEQPTWGGGNLFAGYRAGRGFFQPWYLERQTNDGGEFKAGYLFPLSQNRLIDERRAEVFKTAFGRSRVEPEIHSQLIEFVFFGSLAYWDWVAAGQNVAINEGLLKLATDRQEGIKKRIMKGDLAKIAETDNQRLIVSRQAKLTDARRKLRQSAVKLSLFLRKPDGTPMIPTDDQLPKTFPGAEPVEPAQLKSDVDRALAARPELQILDLLERQIEVDLGQANNLMRPSLDAVVAASQDMGQPTSSKRDKSEFELEAGLYLSVPIQRRKARGKIQATEAKIAQISIKRRFTRDKITSEVQVTYAALTAAFRQIAQARQALDLARTMEEAERKKFLAGDSDLLLVNLRESQTAAAAAALVDAMLQYYQARAAYRATLALDVVNPAIP